MDNKKIVLIDGNSIAYRAFYALPTSISTSTGVITNAVYGFTSMLLKIIDEINPDTIIVAFDSRTPTFRHELFVAYKAQRKKMPDELASQLSLIKEVLRAMNIGIIEKEGYEADDIIAAIAQKVKDAFNEIIIVTGDKDILQLVCENIKVMAVKKGITNTVLYDANEVKEKFGVYPNEIKDYLALMGDSSDNIPGVPGIGPKTAADLIKKFGSIDNLYKNINEIKNEKLVKLLIDNKDEVFATRKLTELLTDVDIDIKEILNKKLEEANINEIEKTFSILEFKTLIERIKKIKVFSKAKEKDSNIEKNKIQNDNNINNRINNISSNETKENNNTVNLNKKLVFSLYKKDTDLLKYASKSSSSSVFFIVFDDYFNDKQQSEVLVNNILIYNGIDPPLLICSLMFDDKFYFEKVKNFFENDSIVKTSFDLKNIYKKFKKINIKMSEIFHDFKIFYLLLNTNKNDVELKEVIQAYGDNQTEYFYPLSCDVEFSEVHRSNLKNNNAKNKIQKDKDQLRFSKFDEIGKDEQILEDKSKFSETFIDEYLKTLSKSDAFKINLSSLLLFPKIEKRLIEDLKKEEMVNLYFNIEEPLIKVIAEMEYKGIAVDLDYLKKLADEYNNEIKKLTEEIYNLSGEKFNINSPKQLSNILYSKLSLKPTRKIKTGLSTDANSLIALIDSHPIIEKILDYREKVKLKNTYIDVLPNIVDPSDGRIHTTYNQLGTATGRLSSNNPNLQNIPVRTDIGKQIRKAFIPGKGYDFLLSADYSQIELRVLAHLSEDEKLIDVFNKGGDIHAHTAAEIFNVKESDVDESLRRKAKAINFGIIYGMTEYGLKSRLDISEEEAKEYIKLYFARYEKVKKCIDFFVKTAYEKGYAVTLFGRRRYINELFSPNMKIRNLGERLAINTPVQGTAADIMKIATVGLFNRLEKSKIDANILLQVHDELVLEIKEKDIDKVTEEVKTVMENCVKLKVALKVDIKISDSWYF